MTGPGGIVAAGHPETARIAAAALRAGGSAVDAAVAGVLASWVCEPLLTGPAAGGHLLVAGPDTAPVAIDAFCAVPGLTAPGAAVAVEPAPLDRIDVDFGDAHQVFHAGGASVAAFGLMDGLVRLHARGGRVPIADLAAPAVELARDGVLLNPHQAHVAAILRGILLLTPESRARWAPDGALLGAGDRIHSPELGETIARLATEGPGLLRDGDLAAACVAWVAKHGGALTGRDLREHRAAEREPLSTGYRDRTVLSAPPPSAGGVLLAVALQRLDAVPGPPDADAVVGAMVAADAARTPAFAAGLAEPGFAEHLLGRRLGGTTHLAVIDADGGVCSVTCTNGEGSGLVVPGTGIHLNNMMGEEDLSPRGASPQPAGARLASMMTPSVILDATGAYEVVLGSAGSARIRSALLQTIVGLVDLGLGPVDAVEAPRLHPEADAIYAEPGAAPGETTLAGRAVVRFRARNLYFGGVQVARRDPVDGTLSAAGDPRRGGAVAAA